MLRDDIFSCLDRNDGILVFPTENSARYYISEYVRTRRCAVLASRVIAFDRFREQFLPQHGNLEAVTPYHRLAFAAAFLEQNSERLKYFYNPAFPESRDRFVSFFTKILPSLEVRRSEFIRNRSLFADLSLLYDSYCAFLKENGLYEPDYEHCSRERLEGKYYLVGFDAESQMQLFYEELGRPAELVPLTLSAPWSNPLHIFDNECAEISTIFDMIEELCGGEVSYDDVILSSPDVQRLRPYLEREASERGIPLDFVTDIPLSDTVPGRYLTLLGTLYREKLSFSSVERFLLCTAFPFTEKVMQLNREIIKAMIENGVLSCGLEFSGDVMRHLVSAEAFEQYMMIKSSVISLAEAKDGAAVARAVHRLNTALFDTDEFGTEAEQRDRFSFILRELDSFSKLVSSLNLTLSSFYQLFLRQLQNTTYNLGAHEKGVKVYRYGQDYLIDVPYHFVFALSAQNTVRQDSELPFLEDYEISERMVVDTTDIVLRYYQSLSEGTYLSSSQETYDGAASAPFVFISEGLTRHEEYRNDESAGMYYRVHSFSRASDTAFSPHSSREDMGRELLLPSAEKPVLSYTQISEYERCPFAEGANVCFALRDTPDSFEPSVTDHMEIGNFLHKVMETFLERHVGVPFSTDCEDGYIAELQEVFRSLLADSFWFDQYTKDYIHTAYYGSMAAFIRAVNKELPSFTFEKSEKKLRRDYGSYVLKGFADTVGSSQGDSVIIDYKKGDAKVNAKGYQLLIYNRLLGKDSEKLLYFSFKDGCFRESASGEVIEAALDAAIEAAASGYAGGVWSYTDERNNCRGCSYRTLCRRRFSVR